MGNKIVDNVVDSITIGEYLKKGKSIYGFVPTSNNLGKRYDDLGNFLNEKDLRVLRFSDDNVETKNLVKDVYSLGLKKNFYSGASLVFLLSSPPLISRALVPFVYENPETTCLKGVIGAGILWAGAICLENLSEKVEGNIATRQSEIEEILSKTEVNILNDAREYVLRSKEQHIREAMINKGLNKIYLENIL